jgi:hypothetical protein
VILPLFGAPVKFGASKGITLVFTIVSVARSYLVRRFLRHPHQAVRRLVSGHLRRFPHYEVPDVSKWVSNPVH